ncbi:segregation and condensation protein A [Haloglycomyces albus]|uniref:segregation and condensation protein A n=1 Tax=Haloglycomyces albus TaxID=526067 RepID=UPI00046D6245|nr:ScpA family protein [Haloglycomyces albus]
MSETQPNAQPLVQEADQATPQAGFHLSLDNFTGPFDLLLQLISKHKLDVTSIALHQIADEFISYVTALDNAWDLEETSEFLLIAATLVDLKCARLLPRADVDDEDDLALLEERDLLFARLLQYKAYKEAADRLADMATRTAGIHARTVGLDDRYKNLLPPLEIDLGLDDLARLAAKAHEPKPVESVEIGHIHAPQVSVREHAIIITRRLQKIGTSSFNGLIGDCDNRLEVVARFLALLELYREALVGFEQVQALGDLIVRWIGGSDDNTSINVDEYSGSIDLDGEET